MSDDASIKKSTKTNPTTSISRSSNFGTIAADYAKVAINESLEACTFTFFQSHVIPKLTPDGLMADSVEEEMVLEVKMPSATAFSLALYMNAMMKEIQANPYRKRVDYGPTAVHQELSRQEGKQ